MKHKNNKWGKLLIVVFGLFFAVNPVVSVNAVESSQNLEQNEQKISLITVLPFTPESLGKAYDLRQIIKESSTELEEYIIKCSWEIGLKDKAVELAQVYLISHDSPAIHSLLLKDAIFRKDLPAAIYHYERSELSLSDRTSFKSRIFRLKHGILADVLELIAFIVFLILAFWALKKNRLKITNTLNAIKILFQKRPIMSSADETPESLPTLPESIEKIAHPTEDLSGQYGEEFPKESEKIAENTSIETITITPPKHEAEKNLPAEIEPAETTEQVNVTSEPFLETTESVRESADKTPVPSPPSDLQRLISPEQKAWVASNLDDSEEKFAKAPLAEKRINLREEDFFHAPAIESSEDAQTIELTTESNSEELENFPLADYPSKRFENLELCEKDLNPGLREFTPGINADNLFHEPFMLPVEKIKNADLPAHHLSIIDEPMEKSIEATVPENRHSSSINQGPTEPDMEAESGSLSFLNDEPIQVHELEFIKALTNPENAQNLVLLSESVETSLKSLNSRIVGVTSSGDILQRTCFSFLLGKTFAEKGRKSAVIDADFDKPRLNLFTDEPCIFGLKHLLEPANSEKDVFIKSEFKNLHLLPSGTPDALNQEQMNESFWDFTLSMARLKFEMVVIVLPELKKLDRIKLHKEKLLVLTLLDAEKEKSINEFFYSKIMLKKYNMKFFKPVKIENLEN